MQAYCSCSKAAGTNGMVSIYQVVQGRNSGEPRDRVMGGQGSLMHVRSEGEDTFVNLELEAVEKQIRIRIRQSFIAKLSAPRMGPTQVSFTLAPGYHGAWKQQQQQTGARSWTRTSPPPPPPVFEILTWNHFAPLLEMECDTVIIKDSIVRHVRATTAKGKVRTHCFPGARVLDVAAQVPAVLNKNIRAVVHHAGTNGTRLRQTVILK
ncbi:hypothetical protein QTP70_009450 [Hemibagrus guttatus]|uniref:Uncharacterized protein n=1 Tax=Hemibagrus guttatus TaxID=175788 RepID=A0AAE0QS84_9TELE|nr:hypothetical protein QTP70_009450 [Hemibagrus guttatus]